jgi:formyltetrahydrofolate synthetase
VAKTGDIMTMPGLPKVPAAEGLAVTPDGAMSSCRRAMALEAK